MQTFILPPWLAEAKKIAIVGYGREGKSTERFLQKYLPQVWVLVFDGQDHFDIPSVDVVFKSPGISLSKVTVKPATYVTSQADLFLQLFGNQTIGVTGTKGKSTTSHAINHVLSVNGRKSILLGNIGKPALDYVDQIDDNTTVVFELSSFQTESVHVACHIAVFTSLYQDHLDYYASYADYVAAKKHLFDLQTEKDLCLYRSGYPELERLLADTRAKKISYAQGDHAFPVNYLPARIIGKQFGLSDAQIDTALKTIQPLPGRLECVATVGAIRFIDDALATIPEATIDALHTLGDDVVVLIAGGHERHQDYTELAKHIVTSNIQSLILFPTTGKRLAQELESLGSTIETHHVQSMEEAVEKAYQSAISYKLLAISSPIVLLSTAAPSFGLFRDYADRSEQYKRFIHALK